MDKTFLVPRYNPQYARKSRWSCNKMNYDAINQLTYVEPFEVKKKSKTKKRVKSAGSSCMIFRSWKGCLLVTIVVLLSSTGCFYSVFLLSDSYFNYEQSTNIIIQVKEQIRMTALSICIFYPTILNNAHPMFSILSLKKGKPRIEDTEKKLTLEAIFDMTPPVDHVLTKCSYRLPNEFDLFKGDKKVCNDIFSVSKYYTVQYMCYRFTPKRTAGQNYSFLAVRYALIDPGLFYQVAVDKTLFENTTEIQPSTYSWKGHPKSRFSTVIKNAPKGSTNKRNETLSHFYLSYYKIRNELLPAPFETNCIDYPQETPFLDKSDCFDHCMRNMTIRNLDKLPFATITQRPIPLKFVTSSDFQNHSLENLYKSFEVQCANTACVKNDCTQLMYVTTFIRREWTSNGLVFRIDTPQSPDLVTTFEPKRDLFEFLIDVFNCFSDWYGWSFMDITRLPFINRLV